MCSQTLQKSATTPSATRTITVSALRAEWFSAIPRHLSADPGCAPSHRRRNQASNQRLHRFHRLLSGLRLRGQKQPPSSSHRIPGSSSTDRRHYGAVSDATASVLTSDCETEEFCTRSGVRQEDTLAPFLFVLLLDWLQRLAIPDDNDGFLLQRRVGRRLPEQRISVLSCADDLALVSSTAARRSSDVHQSGQDRLSTRPPR